MKLNPDCIRDILLQIEESTDLNTPWEFDDEHEPEGRLSQYTVDEITYHIRQCELSGYVVGCEQNSSGFSIRYLSPEGHAFLADIRSDSVWNKTKAVAGKIGAWSLDTLTKVATGIITEMIKKQLAQ